MSNGMTPIMAMARVLVMMQTASYSRPETIADVTEELARQVERRLRVAGRPMTLAELLGCEEGATT